MLPSNLRQAILARKHDIVDALLVSEELAYEDGITAVHLAAALSSEDVLLKLAMRGFGLDNPNSHGIRPLHMAAWMGKTKNVRILLAGSAHPDSRDHGGRTPLHYAARYGCGPCVGTLLAAGATLQIDDFGRDPLHNACLNHAPHWLAALIGRIGADPNRIDKEGGSAMVAQALGNHFESVEWMAKCGGDPDRQDARGHTAAGVLHMTGHGDVVKRAREAYRDFKKHTQEADRKAVIESWYAERMENLDW